MRKNVSREPRTVKLNILAHFNPTKRNMKKKTNLNHKPISSGWARLRLTPVEPQLGCILASGATLGMTSSVIGGYLWFSLVFQSQIQLQKSLAASELKRMWRCPQYHNASVLSQCDTYVELYKRRTCWQCALGGFNYCFGVVWLMAWSRLLDNRSPFRSNADRPS